MKTTILAAIIAASSLQAEVPRGVDKKWDSTLTVRVVKNIKGAKVVKVTATAPSGGPVIVKGTGGLRVPAGKTVSKEFRLRRNDYKFTAYYGGKVLDIETDKKKTGLGTKDIKLRGGGL